MATGEMIEWFWQNLHNASRPPHNKTAPFGTKYGSMKEYETSNAF
jgi:hypothetical protein